MVYTIKGLQGLTPSPCCRQCHCQCHCPPAHLSSRLESTGLFRSDGKCPDGITLVPWKRGRLLVWDATYTCPDTFAPSHLSRATSEAGAVAAWLSKASTRSTWTSINATSSHLWLLRRQVPLGQKPSCSLENKAAASSR